MNFIKTENDLLNLDGDIICDTPSDKIYQFEGMY